MAMQFDRSPDSIDDMALLRQGGMGPGLQACFATSTLGSSVRVHRWPRAPARRVRLEAFLTRLAGQAPGSATAGLRPECDGLLSETILASASVSGKPATGHRDQQQAVIDTIAGPTELRQPPARDALRRAHVVPETVTGRYGVQGEEDASGGGVVEPDGRQPRGCVTATTLQATIDM